MQVCTFVEYEVDWTWSRVNLATTAKSTLPDVNIGFACMCRHRGVPESCQAETGWGRQHDNQATQQAASPATRNIHVTC